MTLGMLPEAYAEEVYLRVQRDRVAVQRMEKGNGDEERTLEMILSEDPDRNAHLHLTELLTSYTTAGCRMCSRLSSALLFPQSFSFTSDLCLLRQLWCHL